MKNIRPLFFVYLGGVLVMAALGLFRDPWWFIGVGLAMPLAVIGLRDLVQKQNAILRNFPLVGHIRYLAEAISPEIQQYFIERHTDGTPISENHRNLIYGRSRDDDPTHPFGTELDLYDGTYHGLFHSIYPVNVLDEPPRVAIGGRDCKQPYEASLLNVSAMSYGALGPTAIRALSEGARIGGFYVNTGEGSLSDYHLAGGGDLVWQIGTAYFGCRTKDGRFDAEEFRRQAVNPQVKMIELKLSQGAKPGHGGVLPAAKNNEEIARIRDVEPHTTVYSPPGHKEFHDAEGLLQFIARLRELSGHKPVGFKLCLGKRDELDDLCRTMTEVGIVPDFITVNGAEGGTGAAPLEFSDHVGLPIRFALPFVDETLRKYGLRDDIRIIASGKVTTAFALLELLTFGADLCNAARAFMLSLGCIQALRCNTNSCPTGVATTNRRLYRGLVVADKKHRVANFHKKLLEGLLQLSAAAGVADPRLLERFSFVEHLSLDDLPHHKPSPEPHSRRASGQSPDRRSFSRGRHG